MVITKGGPCDRCGVITKHTQWLAQCDAEFCHSCADDIMNCYVSQEFCEDCKQYYYCDKYGTGIGYECPHCNEEPITKREAKIIPLDIVTGPSSNLPERWSVRRAIAEFVKDNYKTLDLGHQHNHSFKAFRERFGYPEHITISRIFYDYLTKDALTEIDKPLEFRKNKIKWYKEGLVNQAISELMALQREQAMNVWRDRRIDHMNKLNGSSSSYLETFAMCQDWTLCHEDEDIVSDLPFH